MVKGEVSHELDVAGLTADEVWKIYSGIELGKLVCELLPDVVRHVEVLEGDGGVGTVLKVTFPPGQGSSHFKEKFTKIDEEHRIKVTETIEGGYFELGFSLYRVIFEIIEKDGGQSSTIKSTVQYEVSDDHPAAANASSLVTTKAFELIAEAIAKYIKDNKADSTA